MELDNSYDVVVIGGGAAGLNGALMPARSRRTVVVIDAGRPRNAPAAAVHGLLALDGTPPEELPARGRDQLRGYGGQVVTGEVADACVAEDGFTVTLTDGRTTRGRRLLVTTGLVDVLPDIPGLAEHWGGDVVHCPFCHGWEVRDRPIGVLATGPTAVHQALMFRQLSDDVVLFTHDRPVPTGEDADRLAVHGVPVHPGRIAGVDSADGHLTAVRFADGTVVPRSVLAVATRMAARAGFLAGLGLRTVPHPSGMGDQLVTDGTGATEVAGVYAAGNVTDPMAQVGAAAAAGALAGARIHGDLIEADTARMLADLRDPFSPASEARAAGRSRR